MPSVDGLFWGKFTMRGDPQHVRPEPQFALMVAAAAAVHLALLSLSWGALASPPVTSSRPLIELDVSLDFNQAPAPSEGRTTTIAPPVPEARALLSAQAPSERGAADQLPVSPTQEVTQAKVADPPSTGSAPPSPNKPVRLFLGGDQLSRILKQTTRDVAPSSPDLWQELHTKDASRGLSPASPAVSASYQAARRAPREGSAQLRVRVDAQGRVTSVQLIGGSDRDQWSAMVQDLLARLKATQFRLPPKSAGLELQLRIDRGLLAKDASDRFKVEPGHALGQEPPPRGIVRDDSARASFEESGRISPVARVVDTNWYHDTSPTRVVLEVMNPL